MRFFIGQKVKTKDGGYHGQVIDYKHFVFGTLYLVEIWSGRILTCGWNELEEHPLN